MDPPRYRSFILESTRPITPPLLPEITLRLATEVVPLWQATEAVLATLGLPPPYWAFCWPGGQALARYVLDHPEIVAGRAVLDFAAGCGVAGICAASRGGKVIANDIDPFAIIAIDVNAKLNNVALSVSGTDFLTAPTAPVEIVLAGDVCYEQAMARAAEHWLRARAREGALVLLSDPGRAYRPRVGLEFRAEYEVPTLLELEDREMRGTTIWRVLP